MYASFNKKNESYCSLLINEAKINKMYITNTTKISDEGMMMKIKIEQLLVVMLHYTLSASVGNGGYERTQADQIVRNQLGVKGTIVGGYLFLTPSVKQLNNTKQLIEVH